MYGMVNGTGKPYWIRKHAHYNGIDQGRKGHIIMGPGLGVP